MAEGYLTASGEWIPGQEAEDTFQGGQRSAILSTEPDFAERAVQFRPVLFNNALVATPIIAQHLPAAETIEAIAQRVGHGAWSYFEDLYWYGYGLVAWTGGLGPTQEANVKDTIGAVGEIVSGMLRPAGLGYGAPKRVCIAFGMYVNYTVNYGAPEFIGRTLAGIIFGQALQRVTGVVAPVAWTVHSFALTLATTYGSFVRLGDKFRREFGSLDDLTALDLLIVALNGSADPTALRTNNAAMKDALVDHIYELADRLEDAGERPWYNVIRGLTDHTHHRHSLAHLGRELRQSGDRLAALPVYGFLENSEEFYTIAQDVRNQLLRMRGREYWDQIPLDLRLKAEFYINLFNPLVCDILTSVFEVFAEASRNGMVMSVPASVLANTVEKLNWG
ncbi:hypothetical protein [Vannielia litorea]|uniref:hypothetical protein n=1 Tax=Vannielia litorea TaxID=1217970 RepID=UPI001BCB5041|nr:hypothetical protein [Vannielia litorea]MBS8229160.1 hypothetical protein [Vannielia litorea]